MTNWKTSSNFVTLLYMKWLLTVSLCDIQKCCDRRKLLDMTFQNCIDYEGLHPFDKYDTNVTWWREAGLNIVRMGGADQHIWWMPPGTKIYSPPYDDQKGTNPVIYRENVTEMAFLYGGSSASGLKCSPFDREIIPFSDDVRLIHNGVLVLTRVDTIKPAVVWYRSSDYCIDRVALLNPADRVNTSGRIRDHSYVVISCPCLHMSCIRICCSPRSYLDHESTDHCHFDRRLPKRWNITFIGHEDKVHAANSTGTDFSLVHGIQNCEYGYYLLNKNNSSELKKFSILPNGDARVENVVSDIPSGSFCLAYSNINGTYRSNLLICQRASESARKTSFRSILYGSYFLVGSFFLAITLLVFVLVPEKQKGLHSKVVMCQIINLFAAYVCLSVVQFVAHRLSKCFCIGIAYVIQFAFIAGFLWLNIMCFDIARTFSGYNVVNDYCTPDRNRKLLLLYSAYSWGLSLMVSCITVYAEHSALDVKYKPKIGIRTCWFQDFFGTALYFYFPVGVILCVNIALSAYTASRILKMHSDVSRVRDRRARFRLIICGKLFALMGIPWIFEILSWLFTEPEYIWYVTDGINALRGVLIFFLFCWKWETFFYICKRLPNSSREGLLEYFQLSEKYSKTETLNRMKKSSTSTQRTNSTHTNI